MNKVMAIVAFLIFVGFLSVLIVHVPRFDLMGIIGFTILLAGWDLISTLRKSMG